MEVKSHPDLDVPHSDTSIWRYMDLLKFLDLVTNRRLYFCNVACLSDKYEGRIPQKVLDRKFDEFRKQGLQEQEVREEIVRFRLAHHSMPTDSLVNCWSMGDEESFALWGLYVGKGQPGAAIKSSSRKLRESIEQGDDPHPEAVYMGKVEYKEDLVVDKPSRFQLLTRKMPFYAYENELRLLILRYPRSEGGLVTPNDVDGGRFVAIDVRALIDKIYVSPSMKGHYADTLHELISSRDVEIANRMCFSRI